MDEQKTMRWWTLLRGIACFNIIAWCVLASLVDTQADYAFWQLLCCGNFTVVCAFRSFLPRIDLERYCLVDSYASSMVAGRSAATFAEISFACQVAMLLHQLGGTSEALNWVQGMAIPVVVSLTTAQAFCWYGMLTRNHLGHAIEESLWALTFLVVGLALFVSMADAPETFATVARAGAVFCGLYVCFMMTIDVPMYVRRWRSGEYTDERLGLRDGWSDALHRRVVTRDWAIWKPEVAWLTGYFSGAVWLSMGMAALAGKLV